MNPEMGYNPDLPKIINAENEAIEIHEMVEKGLIPPEQADDFKYENEIEIPTRYLKEPAKISEVLRTQIISKFPPDEFDPEKVVNRPIHGTSFDVIYPLWMGTGKRTTGEYGVYVHPEKQKDFYERIQNYPTPHAYLKGRSIPVKGFFFMMGNNEHLGKHGLNPDPETGERFLSEYKFPLYILFDKAGTWQANPKVLILARWETYTIEEKITFIEHYVQDIREKTSTVPKHKLPYMIPNYGYLTQNLNEEELIQHLEKHTDYLKDLKERNQGEQLYDWATLGSARERIFTAKQVANYASNVMVRGVDKSKIIPVYDWDGNLLWPTEEHIMTKDSEAEDPLPEVE